MATVTAASVATSDSLERFRQEFNTLRSDVSNITSGTITINNESNNRILTSVSTNTFNAESGLTYDGSTFAVSGAMTVSGLSTLSGNLIIPNAGNIGSAGDTDAIAIASDGKTTFSQQTTHSGGILIANAGNIGSAGDSDSIAIASDGVVTFSQAPVFPDGSIAVVDLDIDGATDIGAAIVDADLFIIDDGAGGTNRKTAASRLKTYIGSPKLTLEFESSATDITLDSVHTFSHSLGVRPTLVEVWVKCTDGERGWATGDYLLMAGAGGVGGTIDAGLSIQADATNVEVLAGAEIRIHDQSTFNEVSLSASKWDFVVVAYGGDLG